MTNLLAALQPIISRVRTDISAVKQNGGMWWRRNEPINEERVLAHLNGGPARGVSPIKAGESVTMLALLDFDSHKGETPWEEMTRVAELVADELERHGMFPVPFRSSGGKGIHLFLIWDTPQDAYSVREFLRTTLGKLGYSDGVRGVAKREIEIFPKQDSVPIGGCGNQFILPLAGLSVPLCTLTNLSPMPKEYALLLEWLPSPDVPIVVRPTKAPAREPVQYGAALSEIREMLKYISPDVGYDTWIKIGMALHFETDGSYEGLALWDEWSAGGSEYKDGEPEIKWESIYDNNERIVTLKYIKFLARDGGWNGSAEFDAVPVDGMQAASSAVASHLLNPQDHTDIARKLLQTKFQASGRNSLLRANSTWHEYRGACYEEKTEEAVRASIRQFLDGAKKLNKDAHEVPFHPAMAHISGVSDALRSASLIENINSPIWLDSTESLDPREFISVTNGLLHIPTRSLRPHTPCFFTVNTLPYAWEAEGEAPEWMRFIHSVWDGDEESISTLQEIFGYLIAPDVSLHKIFLIKGPKRSGKGTIGRVLKELVGHANACGPSLSSLASNFGLQPLIGKLVAIVPDARVGGQINKQAIVERLLMVSGEDSVTVDRKHIDAWTGTLTARFIMFTNEVPQLGDASGALASRFVTLSMHKSFYGNEDHGLSERLLKELPQIFRWALDGRERLKARGHFIRPASAKGVMESLEKLNSPITAFASDICEFGTDFESGKDELYEQWKLWCYDAGRDHPGTKDRFCENLLDAFPTVKPSRPRRGDERQQIFKGIRVKKSMSQDVI